jgi:hypothetical protein
MIHVCFAPGCIFAASHYVSLNDMSDDEIYPLCDVCFTSMSDLFVKRTEDEYNVQCIMEL